MKVKAVVYAIAVALSTTVSTSVVASFGGGSDTLPKLERGISTTQILSLKDPKRYEIEFDRPTMLRVSSEQLPGTAGTGSFISATLYDTSGRSVAESSSYQGELYLSRQLEPGVYRLEVSGWTPSGKSDGLSNRYELHVDY
ncbi:hypothetical protein [Halomonas cupida]|uniref:hypothetical protein n=1 Tax=Halomonas cupida TaxID=44933 RepID=UPI003A9565C6